MYVVAQPKPSQRKCSSHVRSEQLGVEASPGKGREKGQEEIPEERENLTEEANQRIETEKKET